LIDAVRRGRREEFAALEWAVDPPDPQDEETFRRSKLNTALHREGNHEVLFEFNRELIRLRKTVPALAILSKEKMDVVALEDEQTLVVRRWGDGNEVFSIFNFHRESVMLPTRVLPNHYLKLLDSDDVRWMGRGPNVVCGSDRRATNGKSKPANRLPLSAINCRKKRDF